MNQSDPRPLPVGLTEFHRWADEIIALAGNFADEDSMKFALCTMLIHANNDAGALPLEYFVLRLRKSAANQVASQVLQDIKTKQAEATAARQQAEAAATEKAADETVTQTT
jgi:hypothetical protein